VLRVQTEERAKEVVSICDEQSWFYIIGLESDKPEDISDVERMLNPPEPAKAIAVPRHNDPCSCGSGKKHKKCCGRGKQKVVLRQTGTPTMAIQPNCQAGQLLKLAGPVSFTRPQSHFADLVNRLIAGR